MKNTNVTIFIICLLCWTCAFAQLGQQKREWVKVDDDSNMAANFYIDPNSITTKNDIRRVFSLTDVIIRRSEPNAERSYFQEWLFKCNPADARKIHISYMEYYSGQMLTGNLLDGGRAPKENYRDLVGSQLLIADVVCSK